MISECPSCFRELKSDQCCYCWTMQDNYEEPLSVEWDYEEAEEVASPAVPKNSTFKEAIQSIEDVKLFLELINFWSWHQALSIKWQAAIPQAYCWLLLSSRQLNWTITEIIIQSYGIHSFHYLNYNFIGNNKLTTGYLKLKLPKGTIPDSATCKFWLT